MVGDERSAKIKRYLLIYGVSALLVILALFLSYRILGPNYDRKENVSINKLGLFHTQLAAERLGARFGTLREELRESGLRLVDSTRGPVTLDSSRWLWLRIQDRDWRAPNYLDPFPAPKSNVDTWTISSAKNSFVLSERIPIFKDGVQDFVLVEGGLKSIIFQDLQSDGNFGIWVFDLDAYKKGGLSVAKLYERMSSAGSLSKEEIKLLTSDMLGQIFQSNDVTVLNSDLPWAIAYKNSSGPSRLGVLGYWTPQATPAQLTSVWFTLAAILLVISLFGSFLVDKFTSNSDGEIEPQMMARSTQPNSQANARLLENEAVLESKASQLVETKTALVKAPNTFHGLTAWLQKIVSDLKDPFGNIQDRLEVLSQSFKAGGESGQVRIHNQLLLARNEVFRGKRILDRIEIICAKDELDLSSMDLELFYLDFERHYQMRSVKTFFDPDLWKIKGEPVSLEFLILTYTSFLQKLVQSDHPVQLSARYVHSEIEDLSSIEIERALNFKIPFVRISFHVSSGKTFGRGELVELFDLAHGISESDIDLPLTVQTVENLGGRLKIKSNSEDGTMITLDLPAFEERKPEDRINAKQFAQFKDSESAALDSLPDEAPVVDDKTKVQIAEAVEEQLFHKENTDSGVKMMRLSEIEKAKSFAEDISDERSRVRSRFRIRKPGEKE